KYGNNSDFSIMDLVAGVGLRESGDQLQGSHPVHGSETGTNFSVSPRENVWHCFRCDSGGGPWSLLAVLERIIDCQEAIPGGLRGQQFKRVQEIALEKGLIEKIPPALTTAEEKPQVTEDTEPHEVAQAILSIFHI